MTRTDGLRTSRIGGGVMISAGVLLALFVAWRVVIRDSAGGPATAPPPAHLADAHGEVNVVVDSAALRRAGIVAASAKQIPYRQQVPAFGRVVDVQELASARITITATQAAATGAQARTDAALQELQRVRSLYADGRNASAKTLEATQAAYQAAAADLTAARAASNAQGAAALQAWGPVVGRWAIDGSAPLDRVLSRDQVLILLALPPGAAMTAPPAHVDVFGAGGPIAATYVSRVARTDPRIQGLGLFYSAPGVESLLPGMTVRAGVPVGKSTTGALVPRSAVVWAAGGAWVYVQTGPTSFVRHPISTDAPTADGYMDSTLRPGTRIVIAGAQFLLSEEYRPPTQSGPAGDPDG